MAAWAPLVPYAKDRLHLEAAQLGVLLLCLGIGPILAMPVTGVLTSRFGCRPVILASGGLVCAVLPFLAVAPTPLLLGVALFLFGATIGTLDVAINVQAAQVEKESGHALMSGFHGMFSVDGIAGAGGSWPSPAWAAPCCWWRPVRAGASPPTDTRQPHQQ